jgi:hypothetical protein
MSYQKYVYWLDESDFLFLKKDLLRKDIFMTEAKKAICVPLARNVKIGFVAPDAWNKYKLCKRQMSWYRVSPFFGQICVVSSFHLEEYGFIPEVSLTPSNFYPPALPSQDEKKRMKHLPSYDRTKPPEWENIETENPALLHKWLKIIGLRGMTYDEVFVSHCANHANFIEPVYYVTDENGIIPYSIDKTPYICSACLEFYNIIGSKFYKKMVVPCPGSVLFAGLPVNTYMEVVSIKEFGGRKL